MIQLDSATWSLLRNINKLDPEGPEMAQMSEPMKKILEELSKLDPEKVEVAEGTLTDGQWGIVEHINNMAKHMGFILGVEPVDDDTVPANLKGKNLLVFREITTETVLNWSEIIPGKMDDVLTSIMWVIKCLFYFYKSKYESMKNDKNDVSQD